VAELIADDQDGAGVGGEDGGDRETVDAEQVVDVDPARIGAEQGERGCRGGTLSALAISENIIVTCDSSSMISEAALTGKPIYIANILPKKNDIRFQRFRNLFRDLNITRNLGEDIENWTYQSLDETNRVAKIIKEKINY